MDKAQIFILDGRVGVQLVSENGEDLGLAASFTLSPGEAVRFAEIITECAREAASEAVS